MSNISDVTHDDKGTIVTKNAPGKIGTVWCKPAVWEKKNVNLYLTEDTRT